MSRARDTANQINRVNSSAADATAITVDSSENVLIGQTTDSTPYDNTSGNGILLGDGLISSAQEGGNTAIFNRMTSDGSIVQFRKDGTTVGSIGTNLFSEGVEFGIKSNTGQLTLGTTSASKHLQFDSDQFYPSTDGGAKLGHSGGRFSDLYLSGGVYLGGTGSANKLDDYEEGTFTPVVEFGGGVTGITYNTRSGFYTKIGNAVYIYAECQLSSKGTEVGNLAIRDLPFSPQRTATSVSVLTGSLSSTNDVMVFMSTNGKINFENRNTGTQSSLTNYNVNNNSTFFVSGTYHTAS
jgi:hypothetical protein